MKSKPFIIKPDSTGRALVMIPPEEKRFSESWLQKLLQDHPDILPVDEIESIFWPLIPLGREINTSVGPIDNLFISKAGYLVMVETKLWRNSQAKRDVLAQAIDYASQLSNWSFEQLDSAVKNRNNKGVFQIIQEFSDSDTDEIPSEDTIASNLRLGRFLILVVSEHIHSSLFDMVKYINRIPHLATYIGLVELSCYFEPDQPDEIIVVPSIVAKTKIIERSIVQIHILQDGQTQITAEQQSTDSTVRSREPLSEEAFWDALRKSSPRSIDAAKAVWSHFENSSYILMKMRKSAVVARLLLPESDQKVSLFFISTDGKLNCWTTTILDQLSNAGIDERLGNEYQSALSSILKHTGKSLAIYESIDTVNIEKFLEVVDQFVDNVLKAASSQSDQ